MATSPPATMRLIELAGLRVRVLGGPDGDGGGRGPLVVLLHGLTAPAEQLVPLAQAVASPGVRVAVPEGPVSLEGFAGGLAWWPVNIGKQIRLRARGSSSELRGVSPDGLPAARAKVVALCAALEQTLGAGPLVLGGFSQGAMLAVDVALRGRRPAALVLLAGTLLAEVDWRPLLPSLRGVPVLMTHGRADDVLRLAVAAELRDLLRAAGAEVEWFEFEGAHVVEAQAIARVAAFVAARASTLG